MISTSAGGLCVLCGTYSRYVAAEDGKDVLFQATVKVSRKDPVCISHPIKNDRGRFITYEQVEKLEPPK